MSTPWLTATPWTDERVEKLRQLAADGLSASAIAAELGRITRNSVIGKCDRVGISLGVRYSDGRVRQPKAMRARGEDWAPKRRTSGARQWRRKDALVPALPLRPENVPAEKPKPPNATRLTIYELRANACRYPISGEGIGTIFCGAQSLQGGPYCEHHAGRCYQAPEPRRRNRNPFRLVSLRAVA